MAEARGNPNPRDQLLRSVRPDGAVAAGGFNVSNDPLVAEIMRMREVGIKANPLSRNEIVIDIEDPVLGANATVDRMSQRTGARERDLNRSIAIEYGKSRADHRDLSAVAAELKKTPAFAGVAREYIEERLQEIAARDERITFATAGEIMRKSITQRANKGTLARGWENLSRIANVASIGAIGTNERDIGGDRVVEQDLVDHYVNEIASGTADRNLSVAQTRERANGALQAQRAVVDRATYELANATELARAGNPQAAALVPRLTRRLESVQGQLDLMLRQPD